MGNYFCHTLLPNYHEAQKYFQRAIDLGDQHSIQNLANVQMSLGKAGEASASVAVQRAAERGNSDACFEMGMRCLEGDGVLQNAMEAFRWFREAAEQGENADAWCYMGFMFETGQGVPANLEEAIECLRHASELGNDVAYSHLIELNVKD